MEIVNNTSKCSKCLHCSYYMYSCRGDSNFETAEKCIDYLLDETAWTRQDQDETYIKPAEKFNEEINNSIKYLNQYKTKTYIFDYLDDDKLITFCYTTEIPKVNEEIIIHENGIFTKYVVSERILGVNTETNGSVWNLYVKKINNVKKMNND